MFVKDGGYKEYHSSEGELCRDLRASSVGENSEDCFESLDTRALRLNEEGVCVCVFSSVLINKLSDLSFHVRAEVLIVFVLQFMKPLNVVQGDTLVSF